MKLSSRLTSIANLIDNEKIVTDVGTDHSLLLIYLLLNNKIEYGYALDNKYNPLEQAKKNISHHDLIDKITVIQNEGIKKLTHASNAVIIAGLGNNTIIDILNENKEWYKNQSLILCPSDVSNVSKLRIFLNNNNFKIVSEKLIYENKKFYFVLKASYAQKKQKELENVEQLYLGISWNKFNEELRSQFISKELQKLKLSHKFNKFHHLKYLFYLKLKK